MSKTGCKGNQEVKRAKMLAGYTNIKELNQWWILIFPFIMYNLQCQEEHLCDRRFKARAGECLDSLWMHLSGQFIRFSVKHFFGNLYWKRTSTKQDPGPRSYPRVSFLLEPKSWSDKIFSPSPSSWALISFVVSHKVQIMDQLNLSCFYIYPFEISRLFSSKWLWCRVRFTCWSLFIGISCISVLCL